MNSKQKEFDIVVNHLFAQGRPAIADNGKCAYRGKDNTMCAVGCRIPDSRYKKKMDFSENSSGLNVGAVVREFGKRLRKELAVYTSMYFDLQATHDSLSVRNQDGTFNKDVLADKLALVAKTHRLVFTRPQ